VRIALFDFVVTPHSGPGGCDVEVLAALRGEHDVTVFTSELAMPAGEERGIEHVRVPTVRHPALGSFLIYFARACVAYARRRLRGERFDLVQATDCSFPLADVCYAHLCHRAYLREVWPRVRGGLTARTVHSWAVHEARALVEPGLMRRARVIVVPSAGLARDVERTYPGAAGKVRVIRNAVDLAHYERPEGFDRGGLRERMATGEEHTAFAFVALGHFERKGLPLLLEALGGAELERARLWVVGGEPGLVASYRARADELGISDRVVFAGRADDVRPYLWSADALLAPSHYEAFSLALLEAAAAGLPLIATRISGSEELLADGVNGIALERTVEGVRAGLRRFLQLDGAAREAMGRAARDSVEPMRPERFRREWRELYASLAAAR
jgi:glycosyltransferase involved in cell wall biosynthesis